METIGMDRAISGYLASKEPPTSMNYRGSIMRWMAWCRENAIDPAAAERVHIEGYMRWLRDVRGIAKTSVRNEVCAIRGLYRYAWETGIIPCDPGEHVKPPRVYGMSAGTFMTREQAGSFLMSAESEGADVLALCRALLLCGLRLSEALGIDVGDFDPSRSTVTIGSRKGDWCQTVSVAPSVSESFCDLSSRRSSGPMIRHRGKRMTAYFARGAVKRIAESIGAEGITPHSLRRTFVTLSRDAGVPDREIIASCGWSGTQMLEYYDRGRLAETSSAPTRIEEYISR